MKTTGTIIAVLSAAAILMTAGCNRVTIPEDIMNEDQMVAFLEDAYLLEGFYAVETGNHYDTLQPEMTAAYDSLLSLHGISSELFDYSVDWYCKHPDIYERIHDTVVARLDRKIEK